MDLLRSVAGDVFAARVSVGVWLAGLFGSWALALSALAAFPRRGRRVALALRRATAACLVELMGLAALVFLDNPGRWSGRAWIVSVSPLALAVVAVVAVAARGDDLPLEPLSAGDAS
jgi:hypothetical protein